MPRRRGTDTCRRRRSGFRAVVAGVAHAYTPGRGHVGLGDLFPARLRQPDPGIRPRRTGARRRGTRAVARRARRRPAEGRMDMKRVLRQDHPQGKRLAARPLRVLAPLLLVIALVAVAVAGYWLKRPAEAVPVACADMIAGCSFNHRGATVKVRFSAQPSPLEPFVLSVRAANASRLSAEFQMVGMDMGFNRYDLHPRAEGVFASEVTLPGCVSGLRDWVLYLDVDGARYALPFST